MVLTSVERSLFKVTPYERKRGEQNIKDVFLVGQLSSSPPPQSNWIQYQLNTQQENVACCPVFSDNKVGTVSVLLETPVYTFATFFRT